MQGQFGLSPAPATHILVDTVAWLVLPPVSCITQIDGCCGLAQSSLPQAQYSRTLIGTVAKLGQPKIFPTRPTPTLIFACASRYCSLAQANLTPSPGIQVHQQALPPNPTHSHIQPKQVPMAAAALPRQTCQLHSPRSSVEAAALPWSPPVPTPSPPPAPHLQVPMATVAHFDMAHSQS